MARIEVPPPVGSQGPPPRSPWRAFLLGALVIVVGIAVVLVVVRTVAFPIFERNSEATKVEATAQAQLVALRTQQALTPVVTSVPAAAPAPTETPAPVATPAPVVTSAVATPAPTPVRVTAAPTPQSNVETAPAVQATATVIRIAAIPTRGPTPPPELDAEISEAYLHYFQVRTEALYALDPTGLDDVSADGELIALQKNIDDDRAQGRALDTDVQHSFIVSSVDGDNADVADRLQDSSIYVDATTHEPLAGEVRPASPDVAPVVTVIYHLRRIDGTWKVIGGTRYE